MRERIIAIVRECLQLRDQAEQKYASVRKNYSLSAEGEEKEWQKAVDSISGKIAQKMQEGDRLFLAKIAQFDEEEDREV